MSNEELIVLKKSSLKKLLGRIVSGLIKAFVVINRETTTFWRRLFSKETRIRKLFESDAIVLFFNTLLFAFIGNVFRGLIGEIMIIIAFLNILTFLVMKMEWVNKLTKK